MKKLISILLFVVLIVSCNNPTNGMTGLSVEDRIASDLAEIRTEAETLLEDSDAAKALIVDLIERINQFVTSNMDYLAADDITVLNEISELLQIFADSIDYNDQLESFIELLGIEIIVPIDPTPAEYFTLAIQIETYRGIYDISSIDAEDALVNFGIDQVIIDTIFNLIDGVITLEDLMVDESGMYTNEEEGVVVGLPLEEDIPVDSPIEVYGTPTVVNDGTRVGMQFDSADDYIIIPADDTNNLTSEGTIDFWMKPSSIPAWGGIIHKGSEDDWSDESYCLQYAWENAITLSLKPEGDPADDFILVQGSTDMSNRLHVWTHVVVTWNMDEAHIYLDGIDDTLQTTYLYNNTAITYSDYTPFSGSTGDVVVGKQIPGVSEYQFDGVISDVKIYNRYIEY